MATYFTPLVDGQDADAVTFNAPLAELDATLVGIVTGTVALTGKFNRITFASAMTNTTPLEISTTINQGLSDQALIRAQATISPTAALGAVYGMVFLPTIGGASANGITAVRALFARVDTGASYSGDISEVAGIYIANANKAHSGALYNQYGLYIDTMAAASINNYAIYTNNGTVRIGGTLDHDGSLVGFYGATPVARQTYGAPTGTATRTTFATGTVTTAQLAERVKALIDDLRAVGLLA